MKIKGLLISLIVTLLLSACGGGSAGQMNSPIKDLNTVAPYPAATFADVRHVIYLPALRDEDNAKVELIIGQEMNVDCNIHRLAGSVSQEILSGWGYNYYRVQKTGGSLSTMMACPNNSNKVELVTMNHNLGLLTYNSRLPIVVYAPRDIQVQYRIWNAKPRVMSANIE